jgi:hypothetical protein
VSGEKDERRRDIISRLNEKEEVLREREERRREPRQRGKLSEKELEARIEIEKSRRPSPGV